jgi:hypothetical protein
MDAAQNRSAMTSYLDGPFKFVEVLNDTSISDLAALDEARSRTVWGLDSKELGPSIELLRAAHHPSSSTDFFSPPSGRAIGLTGWGPT